jgi:hypothetical protein
MPFFVKIAYQAQNKSKITSKGYGIKRVGTIVIVMYGAIKSINRKFYWMGAKLPMVLEYKFKKVEEANHFKKIKIKEKINTGYSPLVKAIIYKNIS